MTDIISGLPECFDNRVVEKILNGHLTLKDGSPMTGPVRANLVQLIDGNNRNMVPVIRKMVETELRLRHLVPVADSEGIVMETLFDEDFIQLLCAADNHEQFFETLKTEDPKCRMAWTVAKTLGIAEYHILQRAIKKAAEEQKCTAAIEALIQQLRPEIEAQIQKEDQAPIQNLPKED